jgi:hypothetical protein
MKIDCKRKPIIFFNYSKTVIDEDGIEIKVIDF